MAKQKDSAEPSWSVRDARNRLSAVVEAARRGQPQLVTRRGAPVVAVIAAEDYASLRRLQQTAQPSFVDHLLAMPRDDGSLEPIEADLREL
jgi:antitoxin Phd